jgi:hypothetical protein
MSRTRRIIAAAITAAALAAGLGAAAAGGVTSVNAAAPHSFYHG